MRKLVARLFLICLALLGIFPSAGCKKTPKPYTRYEITAEYAPENRTLAGTAKVFFQNGTDNAISTLKFQLYANAYREKALYSPISPSVRDVAYYAGESFGETAISSVNGSKSWEVVGDDENILEVELIETLYPGDKVVIDISFLTKLAAVAHRTGVTKKTVNLGNFFPILCGYASGSFYETNYFSIGDPFFSDVADYKVRLTLPKDYTVAATGIAQEERVLESKKVCAMSALNVRDFAIVLSKSYRVLHAVSGGVELYYYYYADKEANRTFDAIKESFAYFEKTFGEYPYESYTVAETGFCSDGMSYPCLTMLSDSLQGEGRIRAVAHETAHQWWGSLVGNNSVENAWLDEGLAEYSMVAFFENHEKYEIKREDEVTAALKEYRSYYDVYGSVLGRTDTRMTRHLSEYVNEYEYRCLTYDKAVLLLDTARKSVGGKKFFAALRKYYESNRYKIASAGHLIGAFEKAGADVHGLFDGFLSGKGIL